MPVIGLWDVALIIMMMSPLIAKCLNAQYVIGLCHFVISGIAFFEYFRCQQNVRARINIFTFMVLLASNVILFSNAILWTILRPQFGYSDKGVNLIFVLFILAVWRII